MSLDTPPCTHTPTHQSQEVLGISGQGSGWGHREDGVRVESCNGTEGKEGVSAQLVAGRGGAGGGGGEQSKEVEDTVSQQHQLSTEPHPHTTSTQYKG